MSLTLNPKEISKFRLWVQNIWIENSEEHSSLGELPYSMNEYFNMYKWWLKREYRFQSKQQS
jgi:hypothetical protein